MCGIIGVIGDKAVERVMNGLIALEYRGYDSAGIAVKKDSKIKVYKATGEVKNVISLVFKDIDSLKDSKIAIGHTRWATHGKPCNENAHPHTDEDSTIAIIHNGIIENYLTLKKELLEKGYNFSSETDSEVIAHLIADKFKKHKDFQIAFHQAVLELQGTFAILCINNKENRIYFAKLVNPLVIGIGVGNNSDNYYCSSDMASMSTLKLTNKFIILEDNEYGFIDAKDGIKVFDISGNSLKTKQVIETKFHYTQADKSNYDYFMLKEIKEIPEVIPNAFASDVSDVLSAIDSSNNIYITACGTSYHAALVAKYVFNKVCRRDVHVYHSSEYVYLNPANANDLLIAISQSGETLDTLTAVKNAKRKGVKIVSLTNHYGSSISRESDLQLYMNSGPEISVVATKTYIAQLIILYKIAFSLVNNSAELEKLKEFREIVGNFLKNNNSLTNVEKIAKELKSENDFYFIGRGLSYPTALEAALKLKEISYKHAEAFPAGELKHGPLSLITDKATVIAISPSDSLVKKIESNILECKSRGAKIVTVTDNQDVVKLSNYSIVMEMIPELFSPISYIVPLQYFAYRMTVENNLNPDKPRNLAKSVTVE
ncbi:MAG: glutamine--fructose-6-phosphate transaminase (isomerizing) [Candidatus Micrarchaeota archaeon]|nr:glutamine--fructose-6-phosphate transaminase (isomerizing) [Candidatus Micrarchaeota archaeon]